MSPDLARAVTLCEGLPTSHERLTEGLLFVFLAFERSPPDENEKNSKRNKEETFGRPHVRGRETFAQRLSPGEPGCVSPRTLPELSTHYLLMTTFCRFNSDRFHQKPRPRSGSFERS